MTKHHQRVDGSPLPGTGAAPDKNAILQEPYPRGRPSLALPATHPPSISALTVDVVVAGRPFQLPEPVLSAVLSELRLTTEAYVGMQDYAEGVAVILSALARNGKIAILA